jgi:hypothetical protein
MPTQTDSTPHPLGYYGPTPPRTPGAPLPPLPLGQTEAAWALQQIRRSDAAACVWKSLIVLGAVGVFVLLVYLWNVPEPSRRHHSPNEKPFYEIIDPP